MSAAFESYQRFRKRGGIADLSVRTKIRLTGADRVRYLNGQVTANVNRVTHAESQRACVTTAKGKLCADVVIASETPEVVAAGGGLIVDAEPELREALLARLERYIIADDVTLEDVTDEFGLLHYLPPSGEGFESLKGIYWSPVDPPLRSTRFGHMGYDIFLPRGAIEAQMADFFPEHHEVLDPKWLEMLRIEAGVPRWGCELDENTLPPEAGLDRTHIDYHKGCYVGQEVISRLKSVGHVNRQLTGFVSSSGAPLAAGAEIFAEASAATSVGTITSAAWSFALEKPIALGYLKRAAPAEGLFACTPGGEALPIAVHALPFTS